MVEFLSVKEETTCSIWYNQTSGSDRIVQGYMNAVRLGTLENTYSLEQEDLNELKTIINKYIFEKIDTRNNTKYHRLVLHYMLVLV